MKNDVPKKRWRFLVEWSILNMIGWAVGIFFVILILDNLKFLEHLAWIYVLAGVFSLFPLGLCIGISQWVKLRLLGINPFTWSFLTSIGFAIMVTLYDFVLTLDSFEYYDFLYWIITIGLVATFPIGGVIIGGIQSRAIYKDTQRQSLWIRAYALGLLLPVIIASFAFLTKSFVINILYSAGLYNLVQMRWIFFSGFLFLVTVIGISILTGDVLLKQNKNTFITINAG